MAVAVDIERQRGEIVVVSADPRDVAHVIGLPVGCLVPGVARDDVELAVVVDVEDARRLKLALAVDRVLLPLRLVGPDGSRQEEKECRSADNRTDSSHYASPDATSDAGQRPGLAVFLGQVLVGLGVVDDPLGVGVPGELFARPERDVAEVADARQAVAVGEVARALGARLDRVQPLAMMAHRSGQGLRAVDRSCGLSRG